jgi:hypothetical protein
MHVISCLGFDRASIASALLCGALVAGHPADGHADAFVPEESQNEGNFLKASGLIQTANLPLVPDLAVYENFMMYVGSEDDRIQKEIQGRAAHVDGRTNFSEAIGINKQEEQDILVILLDAYHRREEIQKQRIAVMHEGDIAAARSDQLGVLTAQAKEAALIKARASIYTDMWTELKSHLADATLRKLDTYVNREFTDDALWYDHRHP